MRFNTLFTFLLLACLAIFAVPKTKADSPPLGATDTQVTSIVNSDTTPVVVTAPAYTVGIEHGARATARDATLLTPYRTLALPRAVPDARPPLNASTPARSTQRLAFAQAETVLRR